MLLFMLLDLVWFYGCTRLLECDVTRRCSSALGCEQREHHLGIVQRYTDVNFIA